MCDCCRGCCSGPLTAVLQTWIRENMRREANGMVWTGEGEERAIGNTANYTIGVATREHPEWYRAFHSGYGRWEA